MTSLSILGGRTVDEVGAPHYSCPFMFLNHLTEEKIAGFFDYVLAHMKPI